MSDAPQHLSADPATERETASFLAAVVRANEVLTAQRTLLDQLGCAPGASATVAEMTPLLADLRRNSHEQRSRLLHLSLNEIHDRQSLIAEFLQHPKDEFEVIALGAFVNAMHRIRTCLDLALGCAEEIVDISDGEVAGIAKEAGRAIRLIYHYSHELNDMASLSTTIREGAVNTFCCSDVLQGVVTRMSRVAADASVKLSVASEDAQLTAQGNLTLLDRVLNYLTLMAIVSHSVRSVECSARPLSIDGAEFVEFWITDDGRGVTLEGRAQLGSDMGVSGGEDNTPVADVAGFAVARRLAKALAGSIDLETVPGQGSRTILRIPTNAVASVSRAA